MTEFERKVLNFKFSSGVFKTKSNIYFRQSSAIDVWQSPKYTSVFCLLCKVSLGKNSELVVIYEYNGRNKFCNVRTERKDLKAYPT